GDPPAGRPGLLGALLDLQSRGTALLERDLPAGHPAGRDHADPGSVRLQRLRERRAQPAPLPAQPDLTGPGRAVPAGRDLTGQGARVMGISTTQSGRQAAHSPRTRRTSSTLIRRAIARSWMSRLPTFIIAAPWISP